MYGAYMLGQSLVYAPNFNSGKVCGARILATIGRVPKVRTEDGVKDQKNWVRARSTPLYRAGKKGNGKRNNSIKNGKSLLLVLRSTCSNSSFQKVTDATLERDTVWGRVRNV